MKNNTIQYLTVNILAQCQSNVLKLLGTTLLFSLMTRNTFSQVLEGVDYSRLKHVYHTFDMAGEDIFGQRFPAENYSFVDRGTGVTVNALTTSRHSSSKMYQTHPQWTPDGKYVVFTSNRTVRQERGGGQAYALSMENFEIVQITTGDRGYNLHLGWHKNSAYHIRENQVTELKLGNLLSDSEQGKVGSPDDYELVLGHIPDSIRPSGLGLDASEKRIFFSSRLEKDLSAIYSFDFETGKTTKLLEVPVWIGHLQANPYVSGEMMYCWETGGDSPQRMWYLSVAPDGKVTNRPVYQERDNDWVTHEVFMGPDRILFHLMGHLDRLQVNQTGLYSLNVRTNQLNFHGQTGAGGYWHCNASPDLKYLVADTFDGKLYRINASNPDDVVLLTQGHRLQSISPFTREAHLHPSVSPDGQWVLINSSLLTESDIMLVPLFPKW
ncbi:TolB family protein [Gaoshiqia sp. Z1-71]|uniref:TolB family protein n=1 Tax=Gaoshiqia hydrogeniformans TaxID=3290090 RepID=UPI003BF7D864